MVCFVVSVVCLVVLAASLAQRIRHGIPVGRGWFLLALGGIIAALNAVLAWRP